jgi:phosphopantetheinyl transferase
MPLYEILTVEPASQIYIWKISESYEELFLGVALREGSLERLKGMKSESHQKGFLAVRKLLKEAGYTDYHLNYDDYGKPHLSDGKHISITHSFDFSCVIISDIDTGIDIELRRPLIMKIAERFTAEPFVFRCRANPDEFIRKLTVVWGVKETIFKVRNEPGISFKDHIFSEPFELEDKKTTAKLIFNGLNCTFNVHFREIENYTLVWAWPYEA